MTLQSEATRAFELGFGPWLIPLQPNSKLPAQTGWPTGDPVSIDTVLQWVEDGFNLGLRTGRVSGVYVVDVDSQHADCSGWSHDDAPRVRTARGGDHYYFVDPDDHPGNTAGRIGAHIDTRGTGGFVVFPGSETPDGTYRWAKLPDGDLPEFPGFPEPEPPQTVPLDLTAPDPPSQGYIGSVLVRETARVRSAPEGSRNDALNRAAFNLGQLVAGGAVEEHIVSQSLSDAADTAGLPDREIRATLRSGLEAGKLNPRTIPTQDTAPAGARPPKTTYILVPGSHTMADGEYVEVGTSAFAREVTSRLPTSSMYRRGGQVGEIRGDRFWPITHQRMRTMIDASMKLGVSKRDAKGEIQTHYRSCNADYGQIVVAYAEAEGPVRELQHLVTHPVYVGGTEGLELATPGWNPGSGTYLVGQVPDPLPLDESIAVLEDLVCDFPFSERADFENFISFMLTPILRPFIGEPVPLFLVGSPIERTGKTKLIEIVAGCTILGSPTPATQIGLREEEREKRIMSTLLSGTSLIHLDNLHEMLNSGALASLVTSNVYQGRVLGGSIMASIVNNLTIAASGNNVHASGELAKRTVPMMLMPSVSDPENRTDFRHPQLKQYVLANRERSLGALLGLVEHWRKAGQPGGAIGFGGFERWSHVVGGIMQAAGLDMWLTNLRVWRGDADDFGAEAKIFVSSWHEEFACESVTATKLYDLADRLEILQSRAKTDRGQRTEFGKILTRLANRPIGSFRITLGQGRGAKRTARLSRI